MALSMLVAIVAAPALLGTQEAIRQSQSKEKREEHRARRCNLIASCVTSSQRSREIDGRPVVLRDNKLWIDTGNTDGTPSGHPYAGYYLPYPESNYEGLVTTITDIAPIMNWVYIDRGTHEVKYGVRADAQPNLTGPFDCTRQDRRLTFDAWEGWCAVEEYSGLWALYYDLDDDGLKEKVAPGTRVLEIELARKEKRFKKEGVARMQDQSTQRKVDATREEPVDEPVGEQETTKTPGVWGAEAKESEQQDQTVPVPEPPKPFIIPKMSLFQDLPYSVTQVPPPPPTPPPAYSATAAALPVVEPSTSRPQQSLAAKSTMPPQIETQSAYSPPPPPEPSSLEQDSSSSQSLTPIWDAPASQDLPSSSQAAALPSPPVPAPLRPRGPGDRQRTPPTRPPRSPPRETSPNQTSSAEKRTTPKLNRNSGSRAIAQAQMFEAWARGQSPPKEASSNKDGSIAARPASVAASSASDYSNPPQTAVLDVLNMYADSDGMSVLSRALDSPPPVPSLSKSANTNKEQKVVLKKAVLKKAADPAVFGDYIKSPTFKGLNETTKRTDRIGAEYRIQRKTSNTSTPPYSRPERSQPPDRPRLSRNKTTSPDLRRQPSAAKLPAKPSPRESRSTTRPRYSPPPAPPLPRTASTSSRKDASASASASPARASPSPSPKPLTRTPTAPSSSTAAASPGRRGITATMTSGTRNRAMTLRVSGKEANAESSSSPRAERGRTTSSLYREIDDLVGAAGPGGGRSRSGTAGSGGSRGRDEKVRGPPLRRVGTSRVESNERGREGRGDIMRSRRREEEERRV